MIAYATIEQVEAGFREMSADEKATCKRLLGEAALIIDAYNQGAKYEAKNLITCRMIRRAIGDAASASAFPIGATQGTVSALGYSQSWTNSNGSSGELYLSKLEKKLLGSDRSIGASNPFD